MNLPSRLLCGGVGFREDSFVCICRMPVMLSALGKPMARFRATRTAFIRNLPRRTESPCNLPTATIVRARRASWNVRDGGSKASQSVVWRDRTRQLIKTLLAEIAVEHAGAERGLLILFFPATSHGSRRRKATTQPACQVLRSRLAAKGGP